MTTDPLAGIERMSDTAMAPCYACKRHLLATGLPVFYRLQVKQCGIDKKEVDKHIGLAMALGGGRDGLALAGVMGPKTEPVVVLNSGPQINVCNDCASKPEYLFLLEAALHDR